MTPLTRAMGAISHHIQKNLPAASTIYRKVDFKDADKVDMAVEKTILEVTAAGEKAISQSAKELGENIKTAKEAMKILKDGIVVYFGSEGEVIAGGTFKDINRQKLNDTIQNLLENKDINPGLQKFIQFVGGVNKGLDDAEDKLGVKGLKALTDYVNFIAGVKKLDLKTIEEWRKLEIACETALLEEGSLEGQRLHGLMEACAVSLIKNSSQLAKIDLIFMGFPSELV